MGGYSDYERRDAQRADWTDPADETIFDEAADWEDDEPVEFEPDPELLRRIEQSHH